MAVVPIWYLQTTNLITMQYTTLYKRTKTGAPQQWGINVVTKTSHGHPVIEKQAGQVGGTLTTHYEVVPEGKQKRTALEQAHFQAASDHKRKHDEGYKSLEDLGGVQARLTDSSVEYRHGDVTYSTALSLLQAVLPTFNSDASGNIKPMLATDWKKIKKIEYPIYCEPKLDGVRCLMIATWTPEKENRKIDITFLSRTGKAYNTLDHIAYGIRKFLANVTNPTNSLILDGEIYADDLNFQEIVSAVKAQKENSLKLHFRAYDVVNDKRQTDRRNGFAGLINAIGSEFIQHIEWSVAVDAEDVKRFHDQYVQAGYEGAILRCFDGKYAQGQRSRELMKVKEFDSEEFTFKYFEFGQRDEDLIAVCKTKDGNSEFKAKMIGTAAHKRELYEQYLQEKLDSESLTVKFFGYTEGGAGIPRFPIGVAFRTYE
jgi:ATP-dependent DNA ligase